MEKQTTKREFLVEKDEAEMRLDRWFARRYPDVSHGSVEKSLRKGEIRIDGKRAKSNARLLAGQKIRVPPYFSDASLSEKIKVKRDRSRENRLKGLVLFQDEDVVALNKPAGLAVQGGTGLRENLDDDLMAFSLDGKTKPKLVHRLDRETSGVLLIARTDYAARKLTEAFRDRATKKIYWALTLGVPLPDEGRIDGALYKSGETMLVAETQDEIRENDAKSAATLYQVVDQMKDRAAFVALWPLTGRTHQIRVHLQHIGTPILGDRLYGGTESTDLPLGELGKGLHLHARRLVIPHPRRGKIDVTAPLGEAMKKSWKWFGFEEKAKIDFDGDF
jgi:23S rRNA pseudouridine955/2504/2580 synthase